MVNTSGSRILGSWLKMCNACCRQLHLCWQQCGLLCLIFSLQLLVCATLTIFAIRDRHLHGTSFTQFQYISNFRWVQGLSLGLFKELGVVYMQLPVDAIHNPALYMSSLSWFLVAAICPHNQTTRVTKLLRNPWHLSSCHWGTSP